MPNLRFFVDAEAIAKEFGELKKEVEEALTQGVKQVASMTHAKTQELASEKLKSTRQLYLNNLEFKEIEMGIWVVSLDQPALFIEEGRKSGSMIPDLLRRNAKTAKDGSRYKAIPFQHNKPPSQTPRKSEEIVSLVKSELKARNIPYKKIEYNADGSPRLGRLHVIKDIQSPRPSARASHGVLDSLTIYQTKLPSGKIRRDIMTFRVASTKHEGSKWIHPGMEGKKFMDEALEWAEKIFNDEILPSILEKYTK
jgi:hypothetical protein